MKKILIFLIIIFTSCYEKKNNSSHNEIIEVKNISLEDKVPIENVSYYKFIPDSVSNVNVDKFNIIESYQIEKNKFTKEKYCQRLTAVSQNGEICGKFTFIFRKKFYL